MIRTLDIDKDGQTGTLYELTATVRVNLTDMLKDKQKPVTEATEQIRAQINHILGNLYGST